MWWWMMTAWLGLASPAPAEPEPEGSAARAVAQEPSPVDRALRLESATIDREALVRGLELRVGERWHALTIEVRDGEQPAELQILLRDEAGRVHTRALALTTATVDERSRELATALALLVEQLETVTPPPPEPPPTPPGPAPPAPPELTGWIGVGPRGALNAGRPADPELGLHLAGGLWLLHDHLQPVVELAWARGGAGSLTVDAVRAGGGLLAGAGWARRRLWGGAGALMRAQWSQARAERTIDGWWASPAILAVVQYRGRIVMLGLWAGVDLLFPPLVARSNVQRVRWSSVRPMMALQVGVRLPPRARARASGTNHAFFR